MRRKPNAEIIARGGEIEHALACAYCTVAPDARDKPLALAMLVLAIELLEDLGVDHSAIRAACDRVIDAPLATPLLDPRIDTTGT